MASSIMMKLKECTHKICYPTVMSFVMKGNQESWAVHDIQCGHHVATYITLILLSLLYWGSVEGNLSRKYKCLQWFLRRLDLLLVW
jgi:hypothetical protein